MATSDLHCDLPPITGALKLKLEDIRTGASGSTLPPITGQLNVTLGGDGRPPGASLPPITGTLIIKLDDGTL